MLWAIGSANNRSWDFTSLLLIMLLLWLELEWLPFNISILHLKLVNFTAFDLFYEGEMLFV
jgi:hypothetical protein